MRRFLWLRSLDDKVADSCYLHRLAAEYELHVVYKEDFHDVFQENQEIPEFQQLMVRMKVVDANGESAIDEEQWEAASACNLMISHCLKRTSCPAQIFMLPLHLRKGQPGIRRQPTIPGAQGHDSLS